MLAKGRDPRAPILLTWTHDELISKVSYNIMHNYMIKLDEDAISVIHTCSRKRGNEGGVVRLGTPTF